MKTIRCVPAVLALTLAAAADAQPAPQFSGSVALRAFVNRVNGPGYVPSVPGAELLEAPITSSGKTSFLPSISLRYGSFVFAGSYHAKTTYSAEIPEGFGTFEFDRREWDASLGYAVLPNVLVSAGWKAIRIGVDPARNQSATQTIEGPFLGAALSAGLAQNWSLYGSLAYGWPRFERNGVRAGTGGTYLASEVGIRYALGDWSPSLRNAGLLFGYRSQSFHFSSVSYSFFGVTPGSQVVFLSDRHDIRQGIDGITLGVAFAF